MKLRITSLLLFVSTLLAPFHSQGQSTNTEGTPKGQLVYICNQGSASISVFDAHSMMMTETIDLQKLGFSANAKPHHIVVEPNGSHWYVSLIGENKVLKFNRANELVGQVELEVPGLMDINTENDELYVGRSMSAVNPPQSFGIIQRSEMILESEVDLFLSRPHALVHARQKNWVLVGSLSANQILSVNTDSDEKALKTLEGPNHVFVNFASSPDGNTMVATAQITGKLLIFDTENPSQPTLVKELNVRSQPWHPVFSSDGRFVYFANKGANSVTIVNMESMAIDAVIEDKALAQPHGAVLSDDGNYLFVTGNNIDGQYATHDTKSGSPAGTLTVINTKTRTVEKIIEVGANPTGIGTRAAY